MASGIKADFSGWEKAAEKLGGTLKVSLARSIGVGAGEVLRDEAKLLAPVKTGLLRDSIYLAFKDGETTESRVVYSVSWNHKVAPHGHLIEFGTYKMPAHPFLRPALDMVGARALQAGIERGRKRLPELLREAESGHRSDA